MALPLPVTVPDVGRGGGIISAMNALNDLRRQRYENQIKSVEAQYAPLTTQANAFSKMAYSNLMGPQYIAKIMEHPELLANFTESQKKEFFNYVLQAGKSSNFGGNTFQIPPPQQDDSLLSNIFSGIRNALRIPSPQNQASPQTQNAMNGIPQARAENTNNAMLSSPIVEGNNINQNAAQSQTQPAVPETQAPLSPKENTPNTEVPYEEGRTFNEKAARYRDIINEGETLGTERGKDIADLGHVIEGTINKENTFNHLASIISNPILQNMRKFPAFQGKQLSYLKTFGSPQEKDLIGQLISVSGNIVKDAAQDYKGAFRKGEQSLITGTKVNENDNIDVAIGKMESMMLINKLIQERSIKAADIMADKHINRYKAIQMAAKELNQDKIIHDISMRLNPKITITNKKTKQSMTLPYREAVEKYNVRNSYGE